MIKINYGLKAVCVAGLALIVQGCRDSDDTVSYIDAESTSVCADVNHRSSNGDMYGALKLVDAAVMQLNSEYTSEALIQEFLREAVVKGDYGQKFVGRIISYCAGNPRLGTNMAAADQLNLMYAESVTSESLATCVSYEDGAFNNEDMLEFIKSLPSPNSTKANMEFTKDDPRFSSDYYSEYVGGYCEANPYKPLLQAYDSASLEAASVLGKEKRLVEDIKNKEIEAAKKKKAEEDFQADLSRYGRDLYSAGTANCDNFTAQFNLSFYSKIDVEPFKKAVMETMNSIPRPDLKYQREAYERVLSESPGRMMNAIVENCSNDLSLEDVVLKTHWVREAKSDLMAELEMSGNRSLGPAVMQQAEECESGSAEASVCFREASDYISYGEAKSKISDLELKIAKKKVELNYNPNKFELDSYGYGRDCYNGLIAQGLAGDAYEKEAVSQCLPKAREEFFSPVIAEINSLEEKLADNQRAIDQLMRDKLK